MSGGRHRTRLIALGSLLLLAAAANAQSGADSARSRAPLDLEGQWVSVVTEDWRWRMVTPPKGDYASVPLNQRGVAAVNEWEPEAAESAPSCLAFGAPGLMRMPMQVRIAWLDDDTLALRTDRGAQTRTFYFDAASAPAAPSRQGRSVATFDGSALKVVTDSLLPGWLRTNGVPYSEAARVTEYYNTQEAFGRVGFTVTTIVHDPTYLQTDFVTSTTFWKVADGADWRETPCREP